MDNRTIGIYDSGIGGITVFHDLKEVLPDESFIYFGDTKNLPYGSKSKAELLKISKAIFDFFAQKNVKALVMACNTTSANVYDEMKGKYPFEIYPLIQTASKCIAERYTGNIGIMATAATVNSNKYREELIKYNPELKIYQQACPELVKMVETNSYKSHENISVIKTYLKPLLDTECANIILGCTHYPYLTGILEDLSNNKVNFINPSKDFVNFIKADLKQKSLLAETQPQKDEFYVSSNPEQFKLSAKSFYALDNEPKLIVL